MQVTFDIPKTYLINYSKSEMIHFLKLYTALVMFQEGKISSGAACELAEVDRYTFIESCKKHNIPIINYGIQEIKDDLQSLKKIDLQ